MPCWKRNGERRILRLLQERRFLETYTIFSWDIHEYMEYMKRYVIAFVCLCAFAGETPAQEYNPTVVVTNKYRATTENARKGEIEMAVPDSVRRFDMTFDYSVFDRPYRGAYEFSPYSVDMKPAAGNRRPGIFFLNAGIGYTLHPELDVVWTPVSNGRLSLDICGSHRSYAGDYRKVGLDGQNRLTGLREDGRRQYWTGWNYDMDNDAGASFRYDWNRVGLTADIAYSGLQQRDWLLSRSLDKGTAEVRVFSKDTLSGGVGFATWLKYGFGHDCMTPKYEEERVSVGENSCKAGVSLNVPTEKAGRFVFDAGTEMASYMYALTHTAGLFEFAPRYRLSLKGWTFDLGLKVNVPFTSHGAGYENGAKSQYVYPAIGLSYDFRRLPLGLWLRVEGGEHMNSYTSVVGDWRHFGISASRFFSQPVLENTVERVSASFGIRGRIRSVFGYEAFVAYSERATSPLESLRIASVTLGGVAQNLPVYGLSYASSGLLSAGADARYSDDWGRVDLGLRYNGLFVRDDALQYVAPAALTGNLSVRFNIMKRIYAGVGCEFATARHGRMETSPGSLTDYRIPGFGEPYFSAEYRHSRSLAFWLRGCRLTGQTIQRTPLYAERGPELTAGLRLSFGK